MTDMTQTSIFISSSSRTQRQLLLLYASSLLSLLLGEQQHSGVGTVTGGR